MVTQWYCVFDQNSRCWTNDTTKLNELIRGNPPFYISSWRAEAWSWKLAQNWYVASPIGGLAQPCFVFVPFSLVIDLFVGAVTGLETSCVLNTCFLCPGVGLLLWSRSVPPGCLLGMMGSIQISWILVGIWFHHSILKNRFVGIF